MSDGRRVLLCPNCGAPLPPGAAHEAVASLTTAEAKGSALACPRCAATLFLGATQDVRILGCGLCGVWLDNDSGRRVIQRFDEAVVDLANRASSHAVKRPDVLAPLRPTAAPAASNALELLLTVHTD
jgi:Zn-finger nucleic acid-binding protein